jgi:hypothetical protein
MNLQFEQEFSNGIRRLVHVYENSSKNIKTPKRLTKFYVLRMRLRENFMLVNQSIRLNTRRIKCTKHYT